MLAIASESDKSCTEVCSLRPRLLPQTFAKRIQEDCLREEEQEYRVRSRYKDIGRTALKVWFSELSLQSGRKMSEDLNSQAAFAGFVAQPILQSQLYQQLCPQFQPLTPDVRARDPSIAQHEGQLAYWLQRFIDTARTSLFSRYGNPIPLYRIRWHEELEERARRYSGDAYSNRMINLRFAVLFYIALNYYVGGPRFYPFGNGNDDNTDAPVMPLGRRLELIARILWGNKRIVMDVVEGRGVIPFVQDPKGRNLAVVQMALHQEAAEGESVSQAQTSRM